MLLSILVSILPVVNNFLSDMTEDSQIETYENVYTVTPSAGMVKRKI